MGTTFLTKNAQHLLKEYSQDIDVFHEFALAAAKDEEKHNLLTFVLAAINWSLRYQVIEKNYHLITTIDELNQVLSLLDPDDQIRCVNDCLTICDPETDLFDVLLELNLNHHAIESPSKIPAPRSDAIATQSRFFSNRRDPAPTAQFGDELTAEIDISFQP